MLIDVAHFPLIWMQVDSSNKSAAPLPSEEFEALLAREEIVSLFIALFAVDACTAKTGRAMRATSIETKSLYPNSDTGDVILH